MNKENCHNSILEVIKEKFQEYWKKPKEYPGLENLFFLKIVGILFTTSDFRHQVVTPCLIFMEQMLIKCRVRTRRDIAYGLFLATLVLEFTDSSKRFMPGCLNYLGGILHMAIPKSSVRLIKVIPPFRPISSDLVLLNNQRSLDLTPKMEVADLVCGVVTESFKVRSLHATLKMINEFYLNFKNLSSNIEIFETIYNYCKMIDINIYPKIVTNQMENFLKQFESDKEKRELKYIAMEAKKPKALRLYEPKIVEVYDGKRYKVQSREKAERDKLIHKLKRAKKGALREIRRDNTFLGRVKITQQIQSDKERKEKVKRIFAEASIQQSELNELDRKKKKK
ncbi:hypothetical protein HHI36_007173 [Cryptolaemus montrouzieri]|uniref:Nucleolar protein 14 n=1 Tax=Cryptolaemus montrouzieri TaxID=559131 RepID=A0ABD2MP19_9CUCU